MADIFGITNKGGRSYNQDYAAFMHSSECTAVIVCDGLGAYDGSDIASEIAAQRILQKLKKTAAKGDDILSPALLTRTVKSAHNAILKRKGTDFLEGCTTIAAVAINGTGAAILTLGDTRVYFFRGGMLEYQSRDHSLAQAAADRGEILSRDIRTHQDQNKLTRVLGGGAFFPPDIHITGALKPGDTFLVMSDGFWEYVYEDEMESAVTSCMSAREIILSLESLLQRRVSGRNDNYSAIALRWGSDRLTDGEIIRHPFDEKPEA